MSVRRYLFTSLFIAIAAVSVFAQGGDTEAANSSNLTGVSLPAGGQRMIADQVPAAVDQALDKVVGRREGKLRRAGTEVLVWAGSDLEKTGAATILNRLSDTLKVAGWKYETSGTENGITFFTVLKGGPTPRAVIGFHGEADGALVFAWTELKESNGVQTSTNTNANIPSGNLPDYDFTTPAGWSRNDSAGKIVLSKDDDKSIAFLPLMESSGNLEQDADRILWQVLKGHDTWYGNGFTPDYGVFEKGKTAQGLEYFRAYRYAKKAGDPNEGFVASRFDAIILLVKIGGKVAVVVGRQPFQSDYARDSTGSAIDLILYDLSFKSVNNPYNLKSEIVGSWAAASTTVAVAYTFNANGSFSKGAVHEFRTRRDRYTDDVTQTSHGMTETYALAGNILTQNYKRTGQIVKHKVRVYQTKYDKDPWQQKLGFLPLVNPDGGTMVLRKSE